MPFPFEPLIVFAWLSIMLLAGMVLRAKIGVFQKFLIPSCLIGGLLGLILINTGIIPVNTSMLETFTYHFFNISFISIGLTSGNSAAKSSQGNDTLKSCGWMALVSGLSFSIQAVVSGLIIILFGLFGVTLFRTFGFLVPLGFTEGPGQALSLGKVWETHGFAHAASIGLTFATIGFLFAFFIGVPLVNWGIRHGKSKHAPKELPREFLIGIIPKDQAKEAAGHLTTHSANVDSLAFQMSLVGLSYFLGYFLVIGLGKVLPPDFAYMLWGVFFFIGMVMSILIRTVASKLNVGYMIDPGIQQRITGWAVDFLMVSTIMAIQPVVVWQYFWPIMIMAMVNGILTTWTVWTLGKHLWDYKLERSMAIFGTVVGTVSSGLLLLRIMDPDFKSPVAFELGFMVVFGAPIILGSVLLVNAPILWGWSLESTIGAFGVLSVVFLIMIKALGMWHPARD